MLIIKIDNIDIEPAQTSFACPFHIIRFAVETPELRLYRIAQDAELGCDHDLFAMPLQCAPDQLLVCVRAVDVGGVKESDPELKRAMNCSERFLIIAAAVKIGHAHATEPDGGDDRAAASEFSLFHVCPTQIRGARSSQRCRIA